MAPMDLLQDAMVTLVALGAMGLLFRRVLGFARPAPGAAPGCANCPSAATSCHPATAPAPIDGRPEPSEHPLVFVRPSQR